MISAVIKYLGLLTDRMTRLSLGPAVYRAGPLDSEVLHNITQGCQSIVTLSQETNLLFICRFKIR